jgi:cytochrome c-type biogenesis protein CcmH
LSDILASSSFLLGLGILVMLALAFLLMPILRGNADAARLRRRRRALEELKDDLPEADYEQRLARLESEEKATRSSAPGSSRTLAVLLLVAVPVCAAVLYLQVGTPQGIDPEPGQSGELRQTLGDLAQQVRENPEDTEAWNRLGMLWKQIQQYPAAESAFRRVIFLEPDNDFARVELAETLLYLSNSAQLPAESVQLLRSVLSDNPENQKALWLAGLGAFHDGDQRRALALWRRLEAQLPAGPVREQVRQQIAQVDPQTATAGGETSPSAGGGGGELPPGHPPIESDGGASAAGGATTATAATADTTGGDTGPDAGTDSATPGSVTVDVTLASDLSSRISGSETVFVFARAVNGPPAPLAVKRLRASALPARVVLSENDSMTQGLSITTFPEIQVSARVSASGNAIASPGDLQGLSAPFAVADTARVDVTIDDVVE